MIPLIVIAGGFGAVMLILSKRKQTQQQTPVAQTDNTTADLAKLGIVGSVAATAIALIKAFRSTTHLVANEWVQAVQNPFGRALAQIVDAKDASIRDGSATKASVTYFKKQVIAIWAEYQAAAEEFAAKDVKHRTVINQSYNTLTPIIKQILSDMDGQIAKLP